MSQISKKPFCIVTFTDVLILSTLSGAANVSKPSPQRCCSNRVSVLPGRNHLPMEEGSQVNVLSTW